MKKVFWSYSIGWDIAALWLLGLLDETETEIIVMCDARHESLYHHFLLALGIREKIQLVPFDAGMTRGKRHDESLPLIHQFAASRSIEGDFVNLEHGLAEPLGQVAMSIEGGFPIALHRSEPYFCPPAALVQEVKEQILGRWNFGGKPLIAVGAHGKLTTLKVEEEGARQQLAEKESIPLSVMAEIVTGATQDTDLTPWFFSVDYRDPEVVEQEIEEVRGVFPTCNLWRADIDHNGHLICVPCWYAALQEIAQERKGRFIVLTGRSNAAHYAAIMDVPLIVLGPSGVTEWKVQCDRLNAGRSAQSRATNVACTTRSAITETAIADLTSRLQ
jgi:hypothetical protein